MSNPATLKRAEELLYLLKDVQEGVKPLPRDCIDKQMPKKKKEEGWFSCRIGFLSEQLKISDPQLIGARDFLIRQGYLEVQRGGRAGNHWLILD